eukprot:261332-Prorocentrum_minimum.AAC.2
MQASKPSVAAQPRSAKGGSMIEVSMSDAVSYPSAFHVFPLANFVSYTEVPCTEPTLAGALGEHGRLGADGAQ